MGLLFNDKFVMFVGLNPSTADELQDDPTMRKCIGFAKRLGFYSLVMTNLFALRETDPKRMMQHEAPIGKANDYWLSATAKRADLIIVAWGTDGTHKYRDEEVLRILRRIGKPLMCFGKNKDGSPKHPLYVSYKSKLKFYE